MTELHLTIPSDVAAFSFNTRREGVPTIPRYEVHVLRIAARDKYDRGLGDIWGHGYSSGDLHQALSQALAAMAEAYEAALAKANSIESYREAWLAKDDTPARPLDPRFSNITLDL